MSRLDVQQPGGGLETYVARRQHFVQTAHPAAAVAQSGSPKSSRSEGQPHGDHSGHSSPKHPVRHIR